LFLLNGVVSMMRAVIFNGEKITFQVGGGPLNPEQKYQNNRL
jgi:hypothetical protein